MPASTASDSEWSGSCRPTGQKASRTLSVPITTSTPRARQLVQSRDPAPVGRALATALQVEVGRRQRGHGDPSGGQLVGDPRHVVRRARGEAAGMAAEDRALETHLLGHVGDQLQPVERGVEPFVDVEIERRP
jgi:hypothetical protein